MQQTNWLGYLYVKTINSRVIKLQDVDIKITEHL